MNNVQKLRNVERNTTNVQKLRNVKKNIANVQKLRKECVKDMIILKDLIFPTL